MTLSKEEIQTIRQIRIHRILGIEDNGHEKRIRCPFHNGTDKNCVIYPENSFYCFVCNAKGSGAIDFCVNMGYSFTDAITFLADYL